MAAITVAALLLAVSPTEQQERYEIGFHVWQTEAARYDVTVRDYQRRIAVETDDVRAKGFARTAANIRGTR